jgi:hypothetical protein
VDEKGRHFMRRIDASLIKTYAGGRRELVWRASIELKPGGMYLAPSDLAVLAHELVGRLREDGILAAREVGG